MSIQAASICQRGGEVLLSRQYVELSSTRIHEILAVYPRLFGEGAQHTTLEEGGVRYIYEPIDELFVVLVSDAASSNILQDLKTLRLFTQLVKETASPGSGIVEPKDVVNATFSIIDAFDEVVTLGFSESLTASQVDTFLRMESHEEKIQQIIERNKQLEAAEERKKKAKQLEAQRQEASHNFSGMSGMGSNPGMGTAMGPSIGPSMGSSLGMGSNIGSNSGSNSGSSFGGSSLGSSLKGKGMKLGKKAPASSAGLPLLADPEPLASSKVQKPVKSVSPGTSSISTDISIAEQLTVEMHRDGKVKTSRVSGTLNLFAGDREHTKLRIKTSTEGGASDYKPHPKMDRALFSSERILGLKNSQEELPASHVLLVKWTVENVTVPLTVSCWVSEAADSGFKNVTLEYEVSSEFSGCLENVAVNVPLPTSNAHVLDPSSNFEQFDDRLGWLIPKASLSENASGSFEFTAEAEAEDDFYPLEVSFSTIAESGPGALTTFGKIDVVDVVDSSTNSSVTFNKTASAQSVSYMIR